MPTTTRPDSQRGRAKAGMKTTQALVSRGRKASTSTSSTRTRSPKRKQKKQKIASEEFKGISFGTMLRCVNFARKWGNHFREKRAALRARARLEPTYRLAPSNPFKTSPVEVLIEKLLEERLKGWQYTPKLCAILCRALTEELKDTMKTLKFERYKYIVMVHIGQRTEQGVEVASRCAWDERYDNYASASYVTDHVFASAQVFAVYVD